MGARDDGDQGGRRAWREGLTRARERWWDPGVVAMDARARAGGGGRTARAWCGERRREVVRELGREVVRELGSGGLVPLFGEYGLGRGGLEPEIGEYARGKRPTTMFGRRLDGAQPLREKGGKDNRDPENEENPKRECFRRPEQLPVSVSRLAIARAARGNSCTLRGE